ncbi:hypothetical protein FM106_15035 [Brachybacterium faecium]|nr:hypothetical protein FM106_15035 [Brachybacterium faecium]
MIVGVFFFLLCIKFPPVKYNNRFYLSLAYISLINCIIG